MKNYRVRKETLENFCVLQQSFGHPKTVLVLQRLTVVQKNLFNVSYLDQHDISPHNMNGIVKQKGGEKKKIIN